MRLIKWSYRIRGIVPRIQINTNAKKRVFNVTNRSAKMFIERVDEKIAVENILIARILVYSAIKIKANGPLLYSVLNPDTSSDSPSAKSKGVRFVSASIVINHRKKIGAIKSKGQESREKEIDVNLNVCTVRRALRRIRAILTS